MAKKRPKRTARTARPAPEAKQVKITAAKGRPMLTWGGFGFGLGVNS